MNSEALIPLERIEKSIYLIRGHKVMLDRDLAALYEVETRVANRYYCLRTWMLSMLIRPIGRSIRLHLWSRTATTMAEERRMTRTKQPFIWRTLFE